MKLSSFASLPFLRHLVLVVVGWVSIPASIQAQHAHIYAGAVSPTPGQPLWFENGSLWDTNSGGGYAESPACLYLAANIPDLYPGLYQTATTFVSEPATIFTGGPSPFAAALGTYVQLRFVSLQGPVGGTLTIWNELDDPSRPTPMFSVPVGVTNGAALLNLSEGDPTDPQADPYGHIHGRRFTLDQPGLYVLGLQLVDTSTHGPQGGPLQSPSVVSYFYLQAGLFLSNFSWSNSVVRARFGLPGLTDFVLESSSTATGTEWDAIAPIVGSSRSELRWMTVSNVSSPFHFFRLRKISN